MSFLAIIDTLRGVLIVQEYLPASDWQGLCMCVKKLNHLEIQYNLAYRKFQIGCRSSVTYDILVCKYQPKVRPHKGNPLLIEKQAAEKEMLAAKIPIGFLNNFKHLRKEMPGFAEQVC